MGARIYECVVYVYSRVCGVLALSSAAFGVARLKLRFCFGLRVFSQQLFTVSMRIQWPTLAYAHTHTWTSTVRTVLRDANNHSGRGVLSI